MIVPLKDHQILEATGNKCCSWNTLVGKRNIESSQSNSIDVQSGQRKIQE
jgi:hypothetical protein